MANARDCGTVGTTVQWSDLGYFGEFSGNAFTTEQSNRVLRIGHRDIIYQGLGMIGYK